MLKFLLSQFIKKTGRNPNAIEMLQLKFKASQGTGQVIPFPQKRSFGEEIDSMIKKGEVNVGTADKTPPYKPSKSQTDFEIQERYRADNAKAIKRFEEKMKKDNPEDMADGGVAGLLGEPTYADGGPARQKFGLGRRAFLKLMGSSVAGIGAAKSGLFSLLKGGGKKQVIKELTSVPINNAPGMPVWFKPLVNKVLKEGKEIESGAERVITHKTKLPNSKTDVYVEQDLVSGDVSVQIGTGKHGWSSGQHGQPVSLQYTAPRQYPTHTEEARIDAFRKTAEPSDLGHFKGTQDLSNKKTKPEFWVEEAEFTGGHPENVKFEESTFEKFGEHGTDFTEVEKFATGKVKSTKPTKKKLRTEYESGKAEADAERWTDELDMASGGRVPRGGGGIMKLLKLLQKKFPGTTKLGQTSRPMAPKTELKQAIAGFQERQKNKAIMSAEQDVLQLAKEEGFKESQIPWFKSRYKAHMEDKAGVGSLEDFHADFVKETGINIPKENLRQVWRNKRTYPFSTDAVDETGRIVGGEATQLMYPKSKKFIFSPAGEDFLKSGKSGVVKTTKVKTGERAGIDVPDMPAGFKLSREKLEQNFPELSLDQIDEIMNLDKEMQGRVITMLKNRRLDPNLYDELLLKHGDTLEFQGEFDKAIRRTKNATGGRVSLSGGGLAGMLGE
jgi:hypothetical protein